MTNFNDYISTFIKPITSKFGKVEDQNFFTFNVDVITMEQYLWHNLHSYKFNFNQTWQDAGDHDILATESYYKQ